MHYPYLLYMEGAPRITPNVERATTPEVYNREATGKASLETIEQMLHDRLLEAGTLSPHERLEKKAEILEEMLEHFGAVHVGTNIPMDNGHRHLAEAAAKMYTVVRAEIALDGMLQRLNMAV
jgi:hypothetical protein